MSYPTPQSDFSMSRPLAERLAAPRDVVRARANSLSARWSKDAASSRQAHAFDDIVELNAHMLKDIGAPSWLISRAIARRGAQHAAFQEAGTTTLTHVGVTHWWARLLMVAGVAFAAAWVWDVPTASADKISVQAPTEGVFTGKFDRGVPVYRLPSITVVANRNIEPTRRSAQTRSVDRARSLAQGAARAG